MKATILTIILVSVIVCSVLIGLVFLVGVFGDKTNIKDKKIFNNTVRKKLKCHFDSSSHMGLFINMLKDKWRLRKSRISQDMSVEFIDSELRPNRLRRGLFVILCFWPLLSLGTICAAQGNLYTEQTMLGDCRFNIDNILSGRLAEPYVGYDKNTMHICHNVYMTYLGNIRVIEQNYTLIPPSDDSEHTDFCGTIELTQYDNWYKENDSVSTGFNVYIYLLLIIYVIFSRGRKYKKIQTPKSKIFAKNIILMSLFTIGIVLFVRFLILSSHYSSSDINISFFTNIFVDDSYEIRDMAGTLGSVRHNIWLYNMYLGIATLIVPILLFIRDRQKALFYVPSNIDNVNIKKLYIISIVSVVIFIIGILWLGRTMLYVFYNTMNSYSINTNIWGNVYYRDYTDSLDCIGPGGCVLEPNFTDIFIYNIYLGSVMLFLPIIIFMKKKWKMPSQIIVKTQKLWNIFIALVLINLFVLFCNSLILYTPIVF